MARPPKGGIDYFPFDVGFYDDKEKIKPIISRFGADGIALLIYLYCDIYKNGFYITVDEDYLHICSMDLRMNYNKIRQMLNYFLERSLFDNKLFRTVKVLTARAIQERYQMAIRERVRKNKAPIMVDRKLWLIPENETVEVNIKNGGGSTLIKVISFSDIPGNNEVFPGNNEQNPWKNTIKESKEKKNNIYIDTPAAEHYFDDPELNEAFRLYVDIRMKHGDKLEPEQIRLLIEQLKSLSDRTEEQIAIINQATMKGWKSFYPLSKPRTSQAVKGTKQKNNRFHNFDQRSYDFKNLEQQLIDRNRKATDKN